MNKRKLSKNRLKLISYGVLAGVLLLMVAIPSIPLKAIEAVIVFFVVVLIQSWYDKKYQLKLLSIDYKNQQTLLKDIFVHSPDLIFSKDSDFEYTACNFAFMEIMGKTYQDEIIGKTDFDLLSCEVANAIRQHDEEVSNNKKTARYTQVIVDKTGKERVYEVIKTPIKNQGILGISRDITDMLELQVAIVEKQSELSAILNNMPYIAYMKDTNGKFIVGNAKLGEHMGVVEGFVGKYPHDFFIGSHADEIVQEDKTVVSEKKALVLEKQIDTIHGKKWFNIHKAPILDKENNVTGIAVIAKDIDAEKNLNNQKETFIATLTHDLKTPTTAQIRALNLVLDGHFGQLNSEQHEILEQTLNSCKYMFNMISTILSTYKIGSTKINAETYNLHELTMECCSEIDYLAKERGHTIIINAEMGNKNVFTDKLEIKRVIINLLSNAIAYAIPNSVVEINIQEQQEDVLFEIKNISHFIPKEELEGLFDKYVSHATKFKQIGTGLGLYLSKQIIENHGGAMNASSSETSGNTFGFVIPRIYKNKAELKAVELATSSK